MQTDIRIQAEALPTLLLSACEVGTKELVDSVPSTLDILWSVCMHVCASFVCETRSVRTTASDHAISSECLSLFNFRIRGSRCHSLKEEILMENGNCSGNLSHPFSVG